MIVVTLVAVACAYVCWQAEALVRERAAMLKNPHFSVAGYRYEIIGQIPWIRWRLGDVDCWGIIGDPSVADADFGSYIGPSSLKPTSGAKGTGPIIWESTFTFLALGVTRLRRHGSEREARC